MRTLPSASRAGVTTAGGTRKRKIKTRVGEIERSVPRLKDPGIPDHDRRALPPHGDLSGRSALRSCIFWGSPRARQEMRLRRSVISPSPLLPSPG